MRARVRICDRGWCIVGYEIGALWEVNLLRDYNSHRLKMALQYFCRLTKGLYTKTLIMVFISFVIYPIFGVGNILLLLLKNVTSNDYLRYDTVLRYVNNEMLAIAIQMYIQSPKLAIIVSAKPQAHNIT